MVINTRSSVPNSPRLCFRDCGLFSDPTKRIQPQPHTISLLRGIVLQYFGPLGMHAYRHDFLMNFGSSSVFSFENTEKLEQFVYFRRELPSISFM